MIDFQKAFRLFADWTRSWARIWREPSWLGLIALFLVLTLPLVISSRSDYDFDELNYHLPAIRAISHHWPALDLRNYQFSAIAPGYYWFLAGLSQIFGTDVTTLRLENLLVSLIGLMLLYGWLRKRMAPLDAALLVAPLATSNFYIKSASWVVTDNASLILVTLTLLLVMNPRAGYKNAIAAGAFGGLATFARQLHAWIAVAILCNAFNIVEPLNLSHIRMRKLFPIWILAACVPLIVIGILHTAWGGLVPERWRFQAYAISTTPLAYVLSVVGLIGAFYHSYKERFPWTRTDQTICLISLSIGGFLATCMPTVYDPASGRWGGYLWEFARFLPAPFDRNVLFMILAPIGAYFIIQNFVKIYRTGQYQAALNWLVSISAWAITAIPNRQVFQRYFEPMTIVFLIVAIGLSVTDRLELAQRKLLMVLVIIQVAITLSTAWWGTFIS